MKQAFALFVIDVLSERNFQGAEVRPGGGTRPRIWKDQNGVQISVVPHGDAFDLYIGTNIVYNVAISRQTAVKFARWLLMWWVTRTWCGFKYVFWDWAVAALLSRPKKAMHAAQRAR